MIIVIVAALTACTPEKGHDPDANLLNVFNRERTKFDMLVAMIEEDEGLQRVDCDWTLPDPPPIAHERLKTYRSLLESVGCVRGFQNYDGKNEIIFIASATGMATGGSTKGYCYTHKTPSLLVESLEAYDPGNTNSYSAFRHIEGNWYLIYEYDD